MQTTTLTFWSIKNKIFDVAKFIVAFQQLLKFAITKLLISNLLITFNGLQGPFLDKILIN